MNELVYITLWCINRQCLLHLSIYLNITVTTFSSYFGGNFIF